MFVLTNTKRPKQEENNHMKRTAGKDINCFIRQDAIADRSEEYTGKPDLDSLLPSANRKLFSGLLRQAHESGLLLGVLTEDSS